MEIRQTLDLLEASTKPAKLETTPLPYGPKDLEPVMSRATIDYHKTQMTDSPINGLILIDCWEPDLLFGQATKNKFFVNLTDNFKKFQFAGVINASTHNIKISKHIEDYFSANGQDVVNLAKQLDFFKLRKHKPWKNINHWLVVGTTWQVCAHLNDMGLCSFSTLSRQHPELNFYGTPWGFLKHNLETATAEDFASDLLSWTSAGELFKLASEFIENLGQSTQHTQTHEIRNKYIYATPY